MPSSLSKLVLGLATVASAAVAASAKVYYRETFDNSWSSRWVQSETKPDYGTFQVRGTRGARQGGAQLRMPRTRRGSRVRRTWRGVLPTPAALVHS